MSSHAFGRGLTLRRQGHHHHHLHRHHSRQTDPEAPGDASSNDQVIELTDGDATGLYSRRSSRSTSHYSSRLTSPLHDKTGRPLRRHGTETFGDLMLHPIKELELHRKRVQQYEEERARWEKEHPDAEKTISNEPMAAVPKEEPMPLLRILIHFRHLMGDQSIRITKAIVDQLKDPLLLTGEEILKLYSITNTDDLIEFFHKSGRNYALKIHKTVKIKKQDESHNEKLAEKDQGTTTEDQALRPSIPVANVGPPATAIPIIDLNDNVYLELKYIWPEAEEEKAPELTRRPIFALPDPDLSDEIGEETSATWLELFGDVFYVGFLATFTHEHHIVDQHELGVYAAWFVVVWWSWCSAALYSSRYDTSDVMHHVYKIIELCGLVGMAGASSGFWDNPHGFIIGYMVMKAVLLIEYSVVLWAAAVSGSFARKPLIAYVSVHALALILWGVSLLYPDDRASRFALWYVSIFVEVAVHIYLKSNKHVSLAASHLGERFALFTIIVLGENCMGFIRTVMESGTEVRVVVANMFGVVIIFMFFFMYFDDFSKEVLEEVQLSQLWMYLHFPLHLCQVAFGIALSDTISIYATEGAASFLEGQSNAAESTTERESHVDPSYVFKSFWVAGGLVLVLNALIKLINTPVAGAKWSALICSTRVLNAIIFFALTSVSYEKLSGLAMLGIMVACLVLQGAIDLLD